MTGALLLALRARLAARGVPYELSYGPPVVPLKTGATRLCLWADTESGDSLSGPKGLQGNPRKSATISIGFVLWVFAQSTIPGAQRFDHEQIARELFYQFHNALKHVIYRANAAFRSTRQGFVTDASVSDGWPGVAYEFRFQVDQPIEDRSWLGAASPEASSWTTTHTLDMSGSGDAGTIPAATTRLPNV
jgi:hypothetical protein